MICHEPMRHLPSRYVGGAKTTSYTPLGTCHLPLSSTMSSAPDLNIDHVAKLARLALTPEEKSVFAQQLGSVLHHIEQLNKVDISGIEPTAHAFAVSNVWQDDVARPGLPVEQALRNAPAQRDHMIVVPKVVE